MTSLRKSIDVIAAFDTNGSLLPIKFKYLDEEEQAMVIRVERVVKKDMDRFAGNKMIKYICETCMNGQVKLFELRYELDTCKWFLYNS